VYENTDGSDRGLNQLTARKTRKASGGRHNTCTVLSTVRTIVCHHCRVAAGSRQWGDVEEGWLDQRATGASWTASLVCARQLSWPFDDP
jgi:hypothetical protein